MGVDASFCAGLPAPASSRACQRNAESVCWGSAFNVTGAKNGRCDSESGRCVCRSGFYGDQCSATAALHSVTTGGAEFTEGVPMGERLQIRWNSSGDAGALPYVNVLLTKALDELPTAVPAVGADWGGVGSYLASNIVNSGVFDWEVGSALGAAIDAGSGYRVVVWFSPEVRAQSAPFAISEPCGYDSCGLHGVCSAGKVRISSGRTHAREEGGDARAAMRLLCTRSFIFFLSFRLLLSLFISPRLPLPALSVRARPASAVRRARAARVRTPAAARTRCATTRRS